MNRVIFFIAIVSLLGCSLKRNEDLKYEIYSVAIDGYFSKSRVSSDSVFIVLNDSISDFKDYLGELIYSVKNNDYFFDEYFKGDTSFKNFILSIKTVDTRVVPLLPYKIKSKNKFIITTQNEFKTPDLPYSSIHFSNVVFNKKSDKAILFVTGGSSGSWYFLQLDNNGWFVANKIMSWVA